MSARKNWKNVSMDEEIMEHKGKKMAENDACRIDGEKPVERKYEEIS